VRIVTCSRVSVRGAQRALSISDDHDFRHLVELTLTDRLRRLAYQQTAVSDTMNSQESDSLMVRRNYLRHQHDEAGCQPFSWYLSNVATSDVVQPSKDAEHFGKLRSASSGLCLGGNSEQGIALAACRDHLYERELLVEMTVKGALVRGGSCLEPTDAAVAFVACEVDSPRQHWWLVDGRLSPMLAPRKCLADSDDHTRRLAKLEDCVTADGRESAPTQHWNFIKF